MKARSKQPLNFDRSVTEILNELTAYCWFRRSYVYSFSQTCSKDPVSGIRVLEHELMRERARIERER